MIVVRANKSEPRRMRLKISHSAQIVTLSAPYKIAFVTQALVRGLSTFKPETPADIKSYDFYL